MPAKQNLFKQQEDKKCKCNIPIKLLAIFFDNVAQDLHSPSVAGIAIQRLKWREDHLTSQMTTVASAKVGRWQL